MTPVPPPQPQREPLAFPASIDPLPPTAEFLELCGSFGVALEAEELERLGRFLALLLHANTQLNLTAIRDPAEAWSRHIFDALTLLAVVGELGGGGAPGAPDEAPADPPAGAPAPAPCIADVGSGGGLPAIPLAIVLPGVRFTLIESTQKKAAFLSAAAAALGLANVTVLAERAEVVGQDHRNHREKYDAVTARAVGKVNAIAELCIPLVKIGGQVVLVKGERAGDELADAKQALHMLHAAHAGTVETPTGRLVVLEKLRKTPRDYPRRVGESRRKPLGS